MLNWLKNTYGRLLVSLIFFASQIAYADIAVNTVGGGAQSIGQVSSGLMAPVGIFTRTLYNICYVIGAMLIMGSIVQYRDHRNNPAGIPLSRPVTLFILGLLLIALPMLGGLSAGSSFLKP